MDGSGVRILERVSRTLGSAVLYTRRFDVLRVWTDKNFCVDEIGVVKEVEKVWRRRRWLEVRV